MIFDAENMFFEGKELSASTLQSDILKVGPGEASDPLILFVQHKKEGSGTLSVSLVTSATEDFSESTTLATYEAFPVKAKLPRGNKGYLKLTAASTYSAGAITAGLVIDDDVLV